MAYKKSKRILRYFLISLGSAMGCIVAISLLASLFMIIDAIIHKYISMSYDLLFTILIIPLWLIMMGAIFGLPVALPAAMIMGGVMLALQERYPIFKKDAAWTITGLISGAITSISATSFPMITFPFTIWFSIGGATGAWVFLKLWRRYPLPPLPDNTQI